MMHVRLCVITYLLSAALLLSQGADADNVKKLDLYAQSAVLIDADSGRILYGKNEDDVMANASTTKILTCILALELGSLEDYAVVSKKAAGMPRVHLGMKEGQYFKMEDLLYSLMLESHNDSAVVIAEQIGGSVEGFAVLMNEKAKSIGCEQTYFITPNGLDAVDGQRFHSTTAEELADIMSYCVFESEKKEDFIRICKKNSHSFSDYKKTENGYMKTGRTYGADNKNAFLHMMGGVLAGKTGFTNKAGYCYVAAMSDNGRNFSIALLACGWPNNKNYKWSDAKTLFRYGLENYNYENIVTDINLPKVKVEGGIPYGLGSVPVYIHDNKEPVEVLLCKDDKVEVKVYLPKKVMAPVFKEKKLGKVEYLVNGDVVKTCEIRSKAGVKKHTWNWSLTYILKNWLIS